MTDVQYIPIADFREAGYLQEANRQWFHPLGLALAADVDAGTLTVWDCRDDPEGIIFTMPAELDGHMRANAENVAREQHARHAVRRARIGYVVQPIGLCTRVGMPTIAEHFGTLRMPPSLTEALARVQEALVATPDFLLLDGRIWRRSPNQLLSMDLGDAIAWEHIDGAAESRGPGGWVYDDTLWAQTPPAGLDCLVVAARALASPKARVEQPSRTARPRHHGGGVIASAVHPVALPAASIEEAHS